VSRSGEIHASVVTTGSGAVREVLELGGGGHIAVQLKVGGRTFDAVLLHDAVDYMTSKDDLRQAVETADLRCRPGGVAVFVPDATAETFTAGSDCGGCDGTDGRAVRYLEWTWDPDPADTDIVTEYVFILREGDGSVSVEHETHHTGPFSRDLWREPLTGAGFTASMIIGETTDERRPRDIFLARRRTS